MFFTDEEKIAIMRIAFAMASVDENVDKRETALILMLSTQLNMKESDLDLAEKLSIPEAGMTIFGMTEEEKCFVCSFLAKIITIDGEIHPSELRLWTILSGFCDFPISLPEAIDKFAEYV